MTQKTGRQTRKRRKQRPLFVVAFVIGAIVLGWSWNVSRNNSAPESDDLTYADADHTEVKWNVTDTLHLREDMSTYIKTLGHKFSFVYPVISGYSKIDVAPDNCRVTEIYRDEKTDLQYLLFEFDNTDAPEDTVIDFKISYNNGRLMTGRTIPLPSYHPYSSKTAQKDYTVKGRIFQKSVNTPLPIGQIITDSPEITDFAQNITSVEELIKKLDEHFNNLDIVYAPGNVGYNEESDDRSGTQTDIETFTNGGDCLDLACLTASVAQKSAIDGLTAADVVDGYWKTAPHALTQIAINGRVHY
ncbi:MAG: hypothetical protein FWF33_07235, partial [Clostridiales bacterium]|nr:hypothetical protein [Clostridiales bacterium]